MLIAMIEPHTVYSLLVIAVLEFNVWFSNGYRHSSGLSPKPRFRENRQRRFVLTKMTTIALIALFIVCSTAATISELPNAAIEKFDNVCTTLTCNNTAYQILNNMDNNVHPCDNFYKFACGGFHKKVKIPDDEVTMDSFSMSDGIVAEQLRSSIEEPSVPGERRPFTLAKDFYKSCMNEVIIEERGYEPLRNILKALGGWPVLEDLNWREAEFQWTESDYKFRKVGYPVKYFLKLMIGVDTDDATKKIIELYQPKYMFTSEDIMMGMKSKRVEEYYRYMVDIATKLGAPRDKALKELETSLIFEMALANITQPKKIDEKITVSALSRKFSSIPWKEYINNILAPYVDVKDDEIVDVTASDFIAKFVKLISNTPKRVQANYVIWKAVEYSIDYLTHDMAKRQLEYAKVSSGVVKLKPRWKKCVEKVSVLLSTQVLYARKYFSKASKNSADKMVADIRDQFEKLLQTISWMDNETKKYAFHKANAISAFVGYPDEFLNDNKLEEFYENLTISDDNYLQNQLNVQRFMLNNEYSNFRKPVNKSHWTHHGKVTSVNAWYNTQRNSINIPAGILQGSFFNDARPKYMNYGAIGTTIAHEITHGFDGDGRKYDKDGNLKNWWTKFAESKYLQKTECITKQYNNYTMEEINTKVNGNVTQNENIADNGGFKVAYFAYKDWLRRHGEEQTLPGLQFNSQQMFWIGAANMFCFKIRPETLKSIIKEEVHAIGEFRILGSLSNIREFADDFNCPVGSKMNPKDKCTLW